MKRSSQRGQKITIPSYMGPYCHRTFGQTPVLASLSQIQPTAVSALQEVTSFFSPSAHGTEFRAHLHGRRTKKILLKKQEIGHGVTKRENSVYLARRWKQHYSMRLCGPRVFSVSTAACKEIDDKHRRILLIFRSVMVNVEGLYVAFWFFWRSKSFWVNLIKFTETDAAGDSVQYSTNPLP